MLKSRKFRRQIYLKNDKVFKYAYYYTRAHVFHVKTRFVHVKTRAKGNLVTAERNLSILQFESYKRKSDKTNRRVEVRLLYSVFEMTQTRCFQRS